MSKLSQVFVLALTVLVLSAGCNQVASSPGTTAKQQQEANAPSSGGKVGGGALVPGTEPPPPPEAKGQGVGFGSRAGGN